ncbi:MAG TPA: ABC transporter ATP-binding protein [Bryobacteraceae bacterium]|nr:ABC transporter ATP-binding protein [Bryobacteraceae bacterium]
MLLVQNVSKVYPLYRTPWDRIRELNPLHSRALHTDFWALRDVSFRVEKGEVVSLVGPNGCGKSTLLQIVSGILQPTQGRVVTRGRIAALLELGAGFNPEFSGRENIFINGEIMGIGRAEMERNLPAIEAFAEIGEFIHRPVKEYSSGMYVRLAFSAAIHVNPDILIVDEALSVGDAVFANRCIRKFEELREKKTTILFVSHDLGLVKQLSNRAIFLLNGQMQAEGEPKHVIDQYIGVVLERQKAFDKQDQRAALTASFRHGDGSSEVVEASLLNSYGRHCAVVESGETVTVRIRAVFRERRAQPMVGILIRNRIGMDVYGTNTRIEQVESGVFEAGEEMEIDFTFECWLTPQQYTVTVATQHPDGSSHDWLDDVITFDVVSQRVAAGVVDMRAKIDCRKSAAKVQDEPIRIPAANTSSPPRPT